MTADPSIRAAEAPVPTALRLANWSEADLRPLPDEFTFAGVDVRIHRAGGVPPLSLPRSLAFPRPARAQGPVAGRIDLRLAHASDLSPIRSGHALRLVRTGAVWALSTSLFVARLVAQGGGRYGAEAWVPPGSLGAAEYDLLQSLVAVVVWAEGGTVLHAAGVELDGGAYLFVGPSGAGKTTACEHTEGRTFAIDRVALMPDPEMRWHAWSIPVGPLDGLARPGSERLAAPVRSILRVRQGTEPGIRRLAGSDALMVVAAALYWPFAAGEGAVGASMDVAIEVARHCRVGEIRTVLARSNMDMLRRFEAGEDVWS